MRTIRLLCGIVLFGVPTFVFAVPKGTQPPKNFPVPQVWACITPVEVMVQSTTKLHSSRDRKSPVVATLNKGQAATVLGRVDVVKRPGLAIVTGRLEPPNLQLPKGTEVYALQEWELSYFHAWYNGTEVEGGLPIGDDRFFHIKRKPIAEVWLEVQVALPRATTGWAYETYAFDDWNVMGTCKTPMDQGQ